MTFFFAAIWILGTPVLICLGLLAYLSTSAIAKRYNIVGPTVTTFMHHPRATQGKK
jgi:hypothetical protein